MSDNKEKQAETHKHTYLLLTTTLFGVLQAPNLGTRVSEVCTTLREWLERKLAEEQAIADRARLAQEVENRKKKKVADALQQGGG